MARNKDSKPQMEIEREVVEAYFESNGFLVRKNLRLEETEPRKKGSLFPTLAVFNPSADVNAEGLDFRLFTGDLSQIRSGLVALLGWGNTSFANSLMTSDARLLKYFKQEAGDARLEQSFAAGPELKGSGFDEFLRLLVVPALPKSEGKLRETISFLAGLGIDGVFTLRSLLDNLLRQSLPTESFQGKSIFQVLQLMKAYDLVREPQLEMFSE